MAPPRGEGDRTLIDFWTCRGPPRELIRVLPLGTFDTPAAGVSHRAMGYAPLQPGDVLAGKYWVERILGQGNMGVVVAATNVALGQRVALKFLLPDRNVGRELVERFLREGRAAARLKSQHVTRVLDVGALDNGAPFMVLEYLEGSDLKALLAERGPLPLGDAVEYVLQACEGLAEAHAAGIVHRDLKPANLFLTTDASRMPCIKIFDFGISKLVGDLTLTTEAQIMGSPLYMSPEQCNSAKDVDGRADLWSLGVSLYELLSGKLPFIAETMEQLCFRIFTGQPTPLCQFRPDVPAGLEAVILQCLQKDRNLRFKNAAELAAARAPWAPPRAAAYPERVARVLDVPTEPARPTAVLPAPPTEAPAADAASRAAAVPASSRNGSTQNTALALSNTQRGRMALLSSAPKVGRGPAAGIVVTCVLLAVAGLVGVVSRGPMRGGPVPDSTSAASMGTAPTSAAATGAAPPDAARVVESAFALPVVPASAALAPSAPSSAASTPPPPATLARRPIPPASPRQPGRPKPSSTGSAKDTIN
jgi:serine/threonine-protein kinase